MSEQHQDFETNSPYATGREQFHSVNNGTTNAVNGSDLYYDYGDEDGVNDIQEVVHNRSPSAMSHSSYLTADASRFLEEDTYNHS